MMFLKDETAFPTVFQSYLEWNGNNDDSLWYKGSQMKRNPSRVCI